MSSLVTYRTDLLKDETSYRHAEQKKKYIKSIIKRNLGYFLSTKPKVHHFDGNEVPLVMQSVPQAMLWDCL